MRILVVDDDRAVRDALRRALTLGSYEVQCAQDGEQALELVVQAVPDAVVLDVGLPGIDGLEVCRRLRLLGNRVPILILTARDAVADRIDGLDVGADDYMVKPFDVGELKARLRALLRRSGPEGGADGTEFLSFAELSLDSSRHGAQVAEHELNRLVLILTLIGGGGIVLAALLGALVARTALAPIARFTRRTETLTGNLDLSRRLEVQGRDELGRLAGSFNTTLDALQRSVEAQRQLVADAGHELRTPIASLRANIQVLGEAERLPAAEQESLRADIVAELDELTALVADVVELARGGAVEDREADEVRLDGIVQAAIEKTRRRGGVRFEQRLEPTVVTGQADRIDRAVGNLLENARKWSPEGAVVEVVLKDGVLTVRDHGPGFQEADLPFVFDRFYRAGDVRKLPGSGLGLAIVRQAADACGGYAEAQNAPGGGALLRVSFGASFVYSGERPQDSFGTNLE